MKLTTCSEKMRCGTDITSVMYHHAMMSAHKGFSVISKPWYFTSKNYKRVSTLFQLDLKMHDSCLQLWSNKFLKILKQKCILLIPTSKFLRWTLKKFTKSIALKRRRNGILKVWHSVTQASCRHCISSGHCISCDMNLFLVSRCSTVC